MTLLDWYEQLNERPDDWNTRLVLADWLEEQEDSLAKVQRWLVEQKKHPMFYSNKCWYWGNLKMMEPQQRHLAIGHHWVMPTWLVDTPLFKKIRDAANSWCYPASYPMIANREYWIVFGSGPEGLLLAERELEKALLVDPS